MLKVDWFLPLRNIIGYITIPSAPQKYFIICLPGDKIFLKTYNFKLILGSQVVERLMIIDCNTFIVV